MEHAQEHNYAVPAFNINNMEQMLAVLAAADRTGSPCIIQASAGARKYANDKVLRHLMLAAVEMYPSLPICLHQDHGASPDVCRSAIENGFTSVMMDGSLDAESKPSSFEYNVKVSKEVVDFAHPKGVSVEGEIGVIGSLETGSGEKEDGHGAEGKVDKSKLVTDPAEAAAFVKATNVDALAVAIGTSHGAYKFTRKPDGEILAIDTVKKIHEKIPGTALVLHGSSSVPQHLLEIINKFGGKIPETYGVPVEDLQRAIKFGVRKINVDTDLRLAATAAIRQLFHDKPAEFDPRKYLGLSKDAMQVICEQRYEEFGAHGKAADIRVISLADMAKRYASGELDAKIV